MALFELTFVFDDENLSLFTEGLIPSKFSCAIKAEAGDLPVIDELSLIPAKSSSGNKPDLKAHPNLSSVPHKLSAFHPAILDKDAAIERFLNSHVLPMELVPSHIA